MAIDKGGGGLEGRRGKGKVFSCVDLEEATRTFIRGGVLYSTSEQNQMHGLMFNMKGSTGASVSIAMKNLSVGNFCVCILKYI